MSIKYHQRGIQPEYDLETNMLTNNWNPDLDYGNEYVKVYFRIDTKNFDDMHGWFEKEEDIERWSKEISSLISSFSILEDSGYKVEHSPEKQAYLYAHPQNISGVILKNDVKRIAEAIDKMKTSSIRWVDLYHTVYDISDEEYIKYLKTKRKEIRCKLFDSAHTNRTTHYYRMLDKACDIAETVKKHRLGLSDGIQNPNGQTVKYVVGIAKEMAAEGYLIYEEFDGTGWIRSLNKTEFKKSKLKKLEVV